MEANERLVEGWKGDENMLETLMEIMEPQLQQREESGRKEGRKEAIQGTVGALRKFNHKDAEIKVIIMDEFGLTEQEAVEYF